MSIDNKIEELIEQAVALQKVKEIESDSILEELESQDVELINNFIQSEEFDALSEGQKEIAIDYIIENIDEEELRQFDESSKEIIESYGEIRNKKSRNITTEDFSYDVSADVAALVEGEELSEEFKNKAAAIFEAAVITRVQSAVEKLTEQFDDTLEEKVVEVREGLVEKIDGYLDFVVEEWMKENEIALENGLKNKITEQFISGMKSLFEQHYIEVPEERYDVFVDMAEQLNVVEDKLNESLERNVQLKKERDSLRKESVVKRVTEGMTMTDADKLKELSEVLSFTDESSFTEKLQTIKESYFKKVTPKGNRIMFDDPSTIVESAPVPSNMLGYVQILDKIAK